MVARGKRVKRAQPLVNVSRKFPPHACGVRESGGYRHRGLRASRLPPATFLAPLRGARQTAKCQVIFAQTLSPTVQRGNAEADCGSGG